MRDGLAVVVAGEGISGLAVAAAARRDMSVEVRERARVFAEIGSGLVLPPGAVAAVGRIGVELEQLLAAPAEPYPAEPVPLLSGLRRWRLRDGECRPRCAAHGDLAPS